MSKMRSQNHHNHHPNKPFFSLLLLLLLLLGIGNRAAGVPLEPFLADWCIEEFSGDQPILPKQDRLRHHHVPIEPFLSSWCSSQFPDILPASDVPKMASELWKHYIPIDQYLRDWGEVFSTEQEQIERYISLWCGAEIQRLFQRELDPFHLQDKDIIPIEPTVGEWCLESYPKQKMLSLKGVVNGSNHTQSLHTTGHEPVEEFIMAWYWRDQYERNSVDVVGITIIVLAFVASIVFATGACYLLIFFCCGNSSIRSNKTQTRAEKDEEEQEEEEQQQLLTKTRHTPTAMLLMQKKQIFRKSCNAPWLQCLICFCVLFSFLLVHRHTATMAFVAYKLPVN